MDAEIINVGTELLIGDQISNNQQFLVTELANIDVNVYCSNTAGFDRARLRELLGVALERSDVILIVGGMGPNIEDITKQTVCDALGLSLVRHEISQRRIEEYCAYNGISINDIILSMADMPAGSVVFRNDNGMCPGCAIRSSSQCIVMLPSSQVEMAPMVRSYVLQYLRQLTDGAVYSQVINLFSLGLTLHDVEERLGGLLNSQNPTIKCIEMTGEVRVRVTAKTASEEASRDLAAPVIRQIVNMFGHDAYGMNVSGLEEVVVKELKDRKMTVSTAESCTAGIISKRITDIPGSSRVFEIGASTYASNKKADILGVSDNILKRYGAVSPEAAAAMAVGARKLAGSSIAVSTTGIAGPGGGTPLKPVGLVYIGLADKQHVWVRKTLIQKPGMDRDYVRHVAASHALDLIRMYIDSLPYLMPGCEPLGDAVGESYLSDVEKDSLVITPEAIQSLAKSVPIVCLREQYPFVDEIVRQESMQTGIDQELVAQQASDYNRKLQNQRPTLDAQGLMPQSGMAQGYGNPQMPMQPPADQAAMQRPVYGAMPTPGMNFGQPMYGQQPQPAQQPQFAQPQFTGMTQPAAANAPNTQAVSKNQKKKETKMTKNAGNSSGSGKKGSQGLTQKLLFFLALTVFVCSASYLVYLYFIEPALTAKTYEDLGYTGNTVVETAQGGVWQDTSTDGTQTPEPARNEDGSLVSFNDLRAKHEDIIGWINVPNTIIDFPVVQRTTDSENNYYYLRRDLDGNEDKNGTIFAHYSQRIAYNYQTPVITLFGHHMRNGNMFQNLMKYDTSSKSKDRNAALEFYKTNPVFTFNTIYDEEEWVIFAVMKLNTLESHGEVFHYIVSDFLNEEDHQAYIDEIRSRSVIDTQSCIEVTTEDRLLLLQTCSYEYDDFRTVIVARKLREGENTVDVSSAAIAADPVMPAVWR